MESASNPIAIGTSSGSTKFFGIEAKDFAKVYILNFIYVEIIGIVFMLLLLLSFLSF